MTEPPPDPAWVIARLRAAGCVRAEEEAAQLIAVADSPEGLADLVARREAGEPLEHVVGWAEFGGVRVRLAPGVFVPRHRSEHLVAVAAAWIRGRAASSEVDRSRPADGRRTSGEALTVLDLCAGSGALGLALHHQVGPFRLVAADLDPIAVACAAQNLAPVGGAAVVGDLFAAVPAHLRAHLGVILANAPYVPTDEVRLLPRDARDHEPALALDGGPDGLAVHRRILAEAPAWLAPGGVVLIEVSDRQAATAAAIVRAAGLVPRVSPDPGDRRTVVVVGQL